MAIKHIARQYDYVGLSTDDKSQIITEGATIYYVDKGKSQIYHSGSWHDKFESVDVSGSIEDITFHNEATVADNGLELTVDNYKNLRISASGTATAFELAFKGVLGSVTTSLPAINSVTYDLTTGTITKDTNYEIDIEGYDSIYLDLVSISGGNITVVGTVS